MAAKKLPEQSILVQILKYDPVTGFLYWRERPVEWFHDCDYGTAESYCDRWNNKFAGKRAFTAKNGNGYYHGSLNQQNYQAHRIIFKMIHGRDPINVDHIDGDRTNNRPENLREVTALGNARNSAKSSRNNSGFLGIDRAHGKFRVRIGAMHLGLFGTLEAAIEARRSAEVAYGFHENHGRPAHPSNMRALRLAKASAS